MKLASVLVITLDGAYISFVEHSRKWLRREIRSMGGSVPARCSSEVLAREWCSLRGYGFVRVEEVNARDH